MVDATSAELGLYIGAGIAVGLGAIGTGLGQREAAAATVGATAEDPEMLGKGLLMTVIPETNVIFGLLVALILIFVV